MGNQKWGLSWTEQKLAGAQVQQQQMQLYARMLRMPVPQQQRLRAQTDWTQVPTHATQGD
jgi:hypothetical protein